MKKLLLIIATVFIATQSFSQWSLTGNSGTTTSNFIGTTDAVDFRIKTSNSTRMTINSSGYAGFNITPETTSRVYSSFTGLTTVALDQVYAASRGRIYNGGTRANGYLGANLNSSASINGFPTSLTNMGVLGIKEDASDHGAGVVGWNKSNSASGTNYGIYGLANGVVSFGGTTDKNVAVYGRASGNINNIGLYGDAPGTGDFAGYFHGRGYFSDKVGIGVDVPSSMLTVDAPTSTSVMSLRSNGTTKMFLNSSGYLGLGTTVQTSVLEVDAPASTSPFKLSINGSTKLIVTTSGNLGIGKGSASYPIDLINSSKVISASITNTMNTGSGTTGLSVDVKNSGSGSSIGGSFKADASVAAKGVYGYANGGGANYGVYGESLYGTQNFGVYGSASNGTASNPAYGVYGTASGSANFWAGYFNGTTYTSSLRVGTTNGASGYIVSVGGKVICEELKVQLEGSWPDYVFDKGYSLMPLEELKNNLNENKHLPGLPSAKTVEADGGYHVGEMQKKLLEKVEELTLYVIKLNDENKDLRKEIESLKK
ncbi:MAG: hypothetical protein ABI723_20025 [Bacteroidia bacterium]